MSALRRFFLGVWDFVVGDDWRTAVGVVLALVLTEVAGAWWIVPVAAVGLLAMSLRRAARL